MEEVPWPENCQRAYVTHVESPNAIFVRDEFLEKKWQEHENWMIAQMFDYLKQKQKEPILSSKLLNKSVMVKDQGLFYRGQVLSVDAEKKKLTVRLVDFGKVVQANIKDVKPLPHKLKKIRPLCYCVSMADVIPTGTSDKSKWSLKAIEYCQDVLPRLEFLMLQPKGQSIMDDLDGLKKTSANLLYKERIVTNPFEPILEKIVNFRDDLTEIGLALKWRGKNACGGGEMHQDVENAKRSDKARALLYPKWSPNGEKEGLLDTSSSFDCDEHFIEAHPWPLPKIPDASCKHQGKISFIDAEGQIYFQSDENVETVNAMTKILNQRNSRLRPMLQPNNWAIGDQAIVQKPGDERNWCRGIITNVFRLGLVEVLYVDYGDKLIIDTRDYQCSPYLEFENVPIQVVRCKLENIVPKGDKYPMTFIRKIQAEFIGQRAQIRITRKHVEHFPLPVILHILDQGTDPILPLEQNCNFTSFLKTFMFSLAFSLLDFNAIFQIFKIALRAKIDDDQDNLNLARYAIKEDVAKIMDSRSEWHNKDRKMAENELAFFVQPSKPQTKNFLSLKELIQISQHYPDFIPMPLPIGEMIRVQPIVRREVDKFCHLLFVHPECENGEKILRSQKNFEVMQSEIHANIDDIPYVASGRVELKLPYLARSEGNGIWYRCSIVKFVTDEEVCVIFWDYGDTQRVHVNDLRELPIQFMSCEKQALHIQIAQDIDSLFLEKANIAVLQSQDGQLNLHFWDDQDKEWKKL